MKEEKKKRIIVLAGIIIVVALIIWLKLFHLDLSFSLQKQAEEKINLIPFIALFKRPHHYILLKYAINVLAYIPFGVCVSVLLKKWYKVLGICIIFSVLLEVLQLLFSLGIADITSVVLNAFGGLIGFLFCKCFNKNTDYIAVMISVALSVGAATTYIILVLVNGYLM